MKKRPESKSNTCRTSRMTLSPLSGRPDGPGAKVSAGAMLAAMLLLAITAGVTTAKSVYVITEITSFDFPTPVHAYDIGPDGLLTFQAEYGVPFYGSGTIGLGVDSYADHLFITFESSGFLLVLNASTLEVVRTTSAPGSEDLAGIVYDHGRELLYCVDRKTSNLYSYVWDPAKGKLNHVLGSPFTLKGAEAYGIALDEINDLLYVGNASKDVTVYSTWDWRLMRTIRVSRTAISVAVDPERSYLYCGAGFAYNFHLTQYDLATGAEKEVEIAPDAGIMGLGVDPATGFVYATTGQNNRPGGDDLLVFDPELQLVQTFEDIGNPTGLVVPTRHTSYNPLHLRKTIWTSVGGEPNKWDVPEIAIGDEFTYSICFNHEGYDLQEISIIDRLPHEVTFVRATGDGNFGWYDPDTHTYRWQNPPLSEGPTTCLELVCLLKAETTVGRLIVNLVTMDTDKTPPTTTGNEAIAKEVTYKPLNLRKVVVDGSAESDGTEPIFVNPGDEVTYRIYFDNKNNTHAVTGVRVIDRLPPEMEFVSARVTDIGGPWGTDGGADEPRGEYDPARHTYTWLFPWLSAGREACVELVARVGKDVPVGTTITNKALVESGVTSSTDVTIDVIASYPPLELRKTIVEGATAGADDRERSRVEAGENITYQICYRNPSKDTTVTHISLVDTLPEEVDFVAADGDGDFGFYDPNTHVYTWFCAPLAPGEEACLDLVAQVKARTEPNTVISNEAVIQSRQTGPSKVRVDAIVTLSPVKAQLFLRPAHIFRNSSRGATIMAIVHLPEGKGKELIADVPLVLTPGGIQGTDQTIYGTSKQGKVLCFFDTASILAATSGYGQFEVKVTGRLVDGRSFRAENTLWILKFGGP